MYYQRKQDNAELEQAQGMGILPLVPIIAGAAMVLPPLISLFKKDDKPRGPSLKQIQALIAQDQQATEKKHLTYGAIGLGVLAVIGIGIYLVRRKN